MKRSHPILQLCPNCGAEAEQSRPCRHRGDWGAADEVVVCNQCGFVYGHAVAAGYIIEQWGAR